MNGTGFWILFGLVAVFAIVLMFTLPSTTANLAEVQTQRTAGIQAVENSKVERAAQEAQTLRMTADLRAEADARTQNTVTLILTAGLMVVAGLLAGGAFVFGLNWYDSRQLQRTLLLIEAQRESARLQFMVAQPPAYVQIEAPVRTRRVGDVR